VVPWDDDDGVWQYQADTLLDRVWANAAVDDSKKGWNVFGHTFASRLARSNVSLDKIAAWLGHCVETCRRYYAQFVPTGPDSDITKLR